MKRVIFMAMAMLAAIAGTMLTMMENQTNWLPDNVGRISGVGCFMVSGLFWMLYAASFRTSTDRPPKGKIG